jgi:membrane-anchored protein YejM (alkaline phosphatase superfamily)
MTDLLTDRAVQYVRRRHPAPFYLALHYTAPHWPWEGPGDTAASRMYRTVADTVKGRFVGGYADGGSLRVFAAMMQRLDEGVGRLLRALDDAGQSRDTFVVFTSDNGGERYSYNWPASDGKTSLQEGGIRVPAIVRWPGRVPAGRTADQSVITMDWTATMIGVARLRTQATPSMGSISHHSAWESRLSSSVRSSGERGRRTRLGGVAGNT